MSVTEYKNSIKDIIDLTNNELLLKYWKKQLEWDLEHENEVELREDELTLVQEGLADYEAGNTVSLETFINSRK